VESTGVMKNIRRFVAKIVEVTGNGSFRKLRVKLENRISGNHRTRI
jgi:hypothetical protein